MRRLYFAAALAIALVATSTAQAGPCGLFGGRLLGGFCGLFSGGCGGSSRVTSGPSCGLCGTQAQPIPVYSQTPYSTPVSQPVRQVQYVGPITSGTVTLPTIRGACAGGVCPVERGLPAPSYQPVGLPYR